MHDTGKSGWFMLIPVYNYCIVFLLLASLLKGLLDAGENEFGADPKSDS